MAAKHQMTPAAASKGKNSSPGLGFVARLLADFPMRLVLIAATAVSCFYLLPLPLETKLEFTNRYIPLLFQLLVLFALRHNLRHLDAPVERQFWNDLSAAHGSWLVASLLLLWVPDVPLMAQNLAVDSLYCFYYLALVLAIERRVHRLHPWRPTGFERALVWPGAALFVLGLLVYFILAPATRDSLYQDNLPSYVLYLSLDLYIATTFLYLARTSAAPRWRALYSGLGIAYGAVFAADLMETFLYQWRGSTHWGSALDLLWILPYVLLVMAARRRHQRFPPPDAESVLRARAEQDLSGPSGRTMGTTLAIPFLHLLCYRFGLLEEHRDLRELVVLVWILLLAIVAAFQHRLLRSRMKELLNEREEFEASLRNGENDLRLLVERSHSQQQIRETEQKFTKAFHANPDAMALSTWKEGRVLEVNATLSKITGFASEDILDKEATDLGMWQTAENRQLILQELEEAGRIRDKKTLVPWPSGDQRMVSVSVEPLEIDGEPCLLTVFQALSRSESDPQLVLFDHSEAAIVMLNSDDAVIYWNDAAEDLYGWSRKEALGQSAHQLWLPTSSNDLEMIRTHLTTTGSWCGEMSHHPKDGQPLKVESWWSRVDAPSIAGGEAKKRLPELLFFGFPR